MPGLKKEDAGWALTRVWLDALEETARDFYGRPKRFCVRAYEHATENWLRILSNEYGIHHEEASTIKEAVESYIKTGVKGGLFDDASQFVLKEINPNRLEIKVFSCPYKETCYDLLEQGYSIKDLTCARLGCFRAAVLLLSGIDCNYEVIGVHLEEGCEGFIERK